jgi:exosortase/archaeosortase family protein
MPASVGFIGRGKARWSKEPPHVRFLESSAFSRNGLFSALVAIGFANSISQKATDALHSQGWAVAIFNTFGISIVVWSAAILAITWLLSEEPRPIAPLDVAAASFAAAAFLTPVPSASCLALTGIALYLFNSRQSGDYYRRAAAVIFAMTVPLFWARLLFATLSNPILEMDAALVGWIVGTDSIANTVPFADRSGILIVEQGCSSLTNVSIAILCSVLFVNIYRRHWTMGIVFFSFLACALTILLNVGRISLIAYYPEYYTMIHGPAGATLAGWLTLAGILAICTKGIRPCASTPV